MRYTPFFHEWYRMKRARIQDILGMVHALYPPYLAEEWDNVGLQVGDPTAGCTGILVALEPSLAAVDAAAEAGANLLLTHHPLIFKPAKRISKAESTGAVLFAAIERGVSIICAHTNLDRANPGLNDWLAARIGLEQVAPLLGGEKGLTKIVVYIPKGYEDVVAEALFSAGGGKIGEYDACSFRGEGVGTFRPSEGTNPFTGEVGVVSRIAEIRLETIIPTPLVNKALAKMIKAHPYEEVAYDLIPLGNCRSDIGLGRIGKLPETTSLAAMVDRVKEGVGISSVRLVGELDRKVRKIALCSGSGAFLIAEAHRQGADVLVTGDLKYHEAVDARERGLAVIDAGHFATERIVVDELSAALQSELQRQGYTERVEGYRGESDPLLWV